MKISVCITVFNEQKTVSKLLSRLLSQTKSPNEIVIVDGNSTDKTVDIIRHYQKRDKRIKLLIKKCSRAEGRNLAVEIAKNQIVAMTDAGCVPDKEWLEKLVEPLRNEEVDIVAGFYRMRASNSLQKAFSVFLGVNPKNFDVNFLASARSIAFRKKLWEEVGGFPESLNDTAEDLVFNLKAKDLGAKYAFVIDARVDWFMPKTLYEGIKKMYLYAKGDAQSGIWYHKAMGLSSHNIKVISIFLRYLFGFILLILALSQVLTPLLFFLVITFYLIWSFRKVYLTTQEIKVGVWGILIQLVSDIAIMVGFLKGLILYLKK